MSMSDDADDKAPQTTWRWPKPRLARACMLYGAGYSMDEIARDRFINSTPANVRRALRGAGVYDGSPIPAIRISIDIPRKQIEKWRSAAQARRVSAEALMSKTAEILADDPVLLDNILDDRH
jgi:predicted transcriptional regulator